MKTKLTIILILFLSSCSLERKLEKYCPLCIQESKTEIVTEYRDTIIKVPGETITLVDSLYCDSLGNVISKLGDFIVQKDGTITRLERKLKNNVYTSKASVDTVYVPVKGNTIYKKELIYKKDKNVKYIPSWINFLSWVGGITLFILLLILLNKILKIHTK